MSLHIPCWLMFLIYFELIKLRLLFLQSMISLQVWYQLQVVKSRLYFYTQRLALSLCRYTQKLLPQYGSLILVQVIIGVISHSYYLKEQTLAIIDYFIPISLFLIRLLVYQILLIKTYRNQTIIMTRLSNPPVYPQISYLIYKTNGLVYIFYNNLKMNEQINEQIIDQMFQQAKNIEQNRKQRNKKYNTCLNEFKTFLNKEVEQLEGTDVQSIKNNDILRDIFKNTYERILDSSDLAIRKIKLTYHQKKLFWNNVIKVNPDMPDIQLKKYFYQQKNNADDLYYQSIDRQKDKHKEYAMIISNKEKKEPLRDYQYSNKIFQGKVYKESNSMNLWQHKSNNLHNDYYNIQPYLSRQNNSHQQFVKSPVYTKNEINSFKSNTYKPVEDKSLSFLNNFIRRQ